jgi:hypothetical protein
LGSHPSIIRETAAEKIATQAKNALLRQSTGLRIRCRLDDPMREWPALARERAKIVDQSLGIFRALFTISDRARYERQRR